MSSALGWQMRVRENVEDIIGVKESRNRKKEFHEHTNRGRRTKEQREIARMCNIEDWEVDTTA